MPMSQLDFALTLVPDPEHFSTETWVRRLEQFESRVILFVGLRLPPGCFGGCIIVTEESESLDGIRYPATEYVVYANDLPAAHREHVLAHELAHITLGHPTVVLSPEQFASWSPHSILSVATPHFSCRASDTIHPSARLAMDQEAERLTRLIYQRVLLARQRAGLGRYSSQQDFERGLRRLGID
jgi:hypothetical protein